MLLPSKYIERITDIDVSPILYKLTNEGNVLISKLKQYRVNYSIPFSGEYIVDGKIFFNNPYSIDLYENIHNDYYLVRHRLEIITEGKLGVIIWTMSDNEVSNKDLEIHEDILNSFVKVGDDKEKNQRWQALRENKNAIIFYGLDFTLFRKLYWEIGIQSNDLEIVDFAIDLYKHDWSVFKGRYDIPNVAGLEFWQTPTFLTFVIAVAAIFTAGYLYTTYFGTTVGVAGATTESVAYEVSLMQAGWTAEEASLIAGGITPTTFGGIAIAGQTLIASGSLLTTALSVAGTASKYLGSGQKPPQQPQQQQPFDMLNLMSSLSSQNTQLLLLALGGFLVVTLIQD